MLILSKNCDLLFSMQRYTPMYLCGFLRLDLGPCTQDLKKLGDEELKTLDEMAAVFAGQAGEGPLESRGVEEGGMIAPPSISKAYCSFSYYYYGDEIHLKISDSGAKVPRWSC